MPKTYVLRNTSRKDLELDFYERYDESYLYSKAVTLYYAINEGDKFKDQVNAVLQEHQGSLLGNKYYDALKAELYFLLLHQFEAFFAILIAPLQEIPTWVYLTVYRSEDIQKAAQYYADHQIKQLTNGVFTNERELISETVYLNDKPADEEISARWEENLDNIGWIIRQVARAYLTDLKAYNSYKHGIRVMTGPHMFALYPTDAAGNRAGVGFARRSEDSVTFLELEPTQEDKNKVLVNETTIHFNPEACFIYFCKLYQILETIKTTRLGYFKGDTTGLRLNIFLKFLDKEWLEQNTPNFRFSSSV